MENEICELCHNNCKINKVTVQGETVAFGFLCGRDYDTKHYVGPAETQYELIKERNKVFPYDKKAVPIQKAGKDRHSECALSCRRNAAMETFFCHTRRGNHNAMTVLKTRLSPAKKFAGAEFCAPMNAFFGHVQNLADKCDYIFLPVYLEASKPKEEAYRYYCYYTQFAATLAAGIKSLHLKKKAIMPVIDHHSFQSRIELFSLLKADFASRLLGNL